MEEACSSQETLVILLGASEWPEFDDFNNGKPETFVKSATDLEAYFYDKFNLPKKNLLNLFNSPDSPNELDKRIGKFLDERTSEMKASDYPARSLLVYFVGHGGFTSGKDYYLAIRNTRKESISASSLRIVSLAETLKKKAIHLRRIIILDCCFAAAAFQFLQGEGPGQVALEKTVKAFKDPDIGEGIPEKGTALLCSSSPNDTSTSISHDGKHTVFSGGLLHVLNTGNVRLPKKCLSLHTVTRLIKKYLDTTYKGAAPIPQDPSPDQSEGDVGDIPFFPNLARLARSTNEKFVPADKKTQCYVVVSETDSKRTHGSSLRSIVQRALMTNQDDIRTITGRDLQENPYVINITEITSSKEMYENAILALCRSSIAVFDVTNFEPAVMLLLGIRSVVR